MLNDGNKKLKCKHIKCLSEESDNKFKSVTQVLLGLHTLLPIQQAALSQQPVSKKLKWYELLLHQQQLRH